MYLGNDENARSDTLEDGATFNVGSDYDGATEITLVCRASDPQNPQTAKFIVHTTNLSAGDEFKFNMSAAGTFIVDCGVGGTLSGTGVNGNVITRSVTTLDTYTCSYSTGGTKTIKFDGTGATGYSTDESVQAIGFSQRVIISQGHTEQLLTPQKILSVEGSLSALFPYKSENSANGAQPRFNTTFQYMLRTKQWEMKLLYQKP